MVIPNPVNENSKIVLPYSILSGSLEIYNDLGQIIINSTFQNKEELLIGDKISVPGLYYYRVTDNENKKITTPNCLRWWLHAYAAIAHIDRNLA